MSGQDEAVRLRAYQIWEGSGRPHGEHESHWHQAMAELGLAEPAAQQSGSTVDPAVTDFTTEEDGVVLKRQPKKRGRA